MRGRRVLGLGTALVVLSFASWGCGGARGKMPELGKVNGKVTYNGKPVTKGTVSFVPTSPGRRNATGTLDPNGYYKLQTETAGDGAELGDYDVTIFSHDEPILDYKPKVPVKPQPLVPTKYENPKTSGLKRTVKSGSNTFDFELTD